jgi:PPP family 3-phenylpropionic acid transporter
MPKVLTDFGYSASEVGIICAAAPFMRFLLPFLFKYLVKLDHRVYLFSLLLTLVATLIFMGTVENFYLYFIANLLFGASMGISLPFVETIALHQLSKEEYGKIRLWGSVGFIIIALWLGEMLTNPYQALYYLFGTAFLTLIFGYLSLRYDIESEPISKENETQFSLIRFWAFWVSIFLMQLSFAGFYNFFTIYEIDHGVTLQVASWMWSFGVICEIVMLYFQSKLLQRNLLTILKIATLITVFRWLLLYLYPNNIEITFASQSLHAISFALYHTAAISYVFSLYSQKKLAQQFLLGIGFGLGGALGSILAGQIYGESIFLIEAIITLGAFGMLLIHSRRVAT